MQQPFVMTPPSGERGVAHRGVEVERTLITSTEHGALAMASTLRTVPGGTGWYRLRTWHAVSELSLN